MVYFIPGNGIFYTSRFILYIRKVDHFIHPEMDYCIHPGNGPFHTSGSGCTDAVSGFLSSHRPHNFISLGDFFNNSTSSRHRARFMNSSKTIGKRSTFAICISLYDSILSDHCPRIFSGHRHWNRVVSSHRLRMFSCHRPHNRI